MSKEFTRNEESLTLLTIKVANELGDKKVGKTHVYKSINAAKRESKKLSVKFGHGINLS